MLAIIAESSCSFGDGPIAQSFPLQVVWQGLMIYEGLSFISLPESPD